MENIRRIPDPRCDGVISKDPLEPRNVIPPAPDAPKESQPKPIKKGDVTVQLETGGDGPTRPH